MCGECGASGWRGAVRVVDVVGRGVVLFES